MNERIINTIDDLYQMLDAAIQLEHATIPPYLTALYSIHPETNLEATAVIRAVLVEEMLHMTLSANVLNALGRHPNVLSEGFMPSFPTYLPDGEKDFQVSIAAFTPETLETFLNIERPSKPPKNTSSTCPNGCITRANHARFHLDAIKPLKSPTYSFYSIGDFYDAIIDGIKFLETQARECGETIFIGDPKYQVSNKYYYSGGGEVIEVMDEKSAIAALNLIKEQGEGKAELGEDTENQEFDSEGELSHYYRFKQLQFGRYYQKGDRPSNPTGAKFEVDFSKVYPIKTNPKLSDFAENPTLLKAAKDFNHSYHEFLGIINDAFSGHQNLLLGAVCDMFRLKEFASQLIRNPISIEPNMHAGPTFEIDASSRGSLNDTVGQTCVHKERA
ncbi:ferritin-like domain-containing protein [Pseudoalteromonas umbrosa]|uniref:ferritin-like domain-containing protein n=1 Tax=Pseudoalteromonas umbrosa TaxID=3048489 RepID=UPI0024C420BA|nr:ferritin-like protein [Pseudoalteromonas sp. B95]MDK1289876.1 ferritin-like protein [Pseudoalteromonas sp. B95]